MPIFLQKVNMEKQFKQLEINLKAHRDQYINQLLIKKSQDLLHATEDLKKSQNKREKNNHKKCIIF